MTRENMINYVTENIKNYLPAEYQDAEVDVLCVDRLNCRYTGLSLRRPDQCLVPTLNLDKALRMVKDEDDLKKMMEAMVKELLESEKPDFDLRVITDYSLAKTKLFIKVVSAEANTVMLQSIPHEIFEDLAVTFNVMLKNDEDSMASAVIRSHMLDVWGVDYDTMVKDALVNSMKMMPSKVCSLAEQLGLMGALVEDDNPLVLVTNQSGQHGAAALFYPGVIDSLASRLNENFYVLPSSLHEVLVLPESKCFADVSELKNMVTEVNETQVSPEDKLTDSVYFVDISTMKLSKVA